ncbi:ClpP/crotonase-like domain-containing protein [Hyaloraphidium curvatum]|nr:ClpP/crotonase-like domain-containing protein [Hyaloraphidium curvatum]
MTDVLAQYNAIHGLGPLQTIQLSFPAEYVLHVEMARPNQLNAMSPRFFQEVEHVFKRIPEDGDVRAVIISAQGRMFCAGLDLKATAGANGSSAQKGRDLDDPARKAYWIVRGLRKTIEGCFRAVEECGKPVIAVSHGICIGGGMELMSACDIRYCSADAVFSLREAEMGIPADGGGLQRISKSCGNQSFVRDLALTARNVPAQKALVGGFVSEILPTREAAIEAALETARMIAAKSPIASTSIKDVLLFTRDHSVDASIKYNHLHNAFVNQGKDMEAGKASLLAKKAPVYPKL